MAKAKLPRVIPGAVSPTEAAVFSEVMNRILRRSLSDTQGAAGIGSLQEKRMHLALKTYICPDTTCHERPVPVRDTTDITEETDAPDVPGASHRPTGMVADVLTPDGRIYEIQTGGFYPLKKKIARYLAHTDCHVTVVHPLPADKYVSWISPADGQVVSRHASPKHAKVTDIAGELYWLSEFVGHPRFSLRLLFLDVEEYRFRDGWGRDGKRGSRRYERFPTALRGCVELTTPADYAAYFLPSSLGDTPFTAAQYAKATGIRGRATYSTLHLMTRLGLVAETEKIGRSQGFCLVPGPEEPATAALVADERKRTEKDD